MFGRKAILIIFAIIKLIVIGYLGFICVMLFHSADADQGMMRFFEFFVLGLVGFVVFVFAHIRPFDSRCPNERWSVPCNHLVHFYGDRAMEEGHAGPRWFLVLMRQIYVHPWFSWGALAIFLLTTASYFLA